MGIIRFISWLQKTSVKLKLRRFYRRKIRSLLDGTEHLSKEQTRDVRKFYKPYRNIKLYWHKWYFSKNGLFNVKYIPEDMFYADIEPSLNNDLFTIALDDKNFYDIIFNSEKIVLPQTLVRNINGYLCNGDYNHISMEEAFSICSSVPEIILKKSINVGGGHDIKFVECRGERDSFNKLIANYSDNFIIQRVIRQHPTLAAFNESSVNTLKVLSILWNNEVKILSSLLRMGLSNSRVDNESVGGISVGIKENGKLKKYAYSGTGKQYVIHPTTHIAFDGIEIPFYIKIVEQTKFLHKRFAHFGLISWDFAVSESTPVLIEYNPLGQGINFHQFNNGPLFGELTEEILYKCYCEKK